MLCRVVHTNTMISKWAQQGKSQQLMPRSGFKLTAVGKSVQGSDQLLHPNPMDPLFVSLLLHVPVTETGLLRQYDMPTHWDRRSRLDLIFKRTDMVLEDKLVYKLVKTIGHCSTVNGKFLIVLDFLVTTICSDTLASKGILNWQPLSNKSSVN